MNSARRIFLALTLLLGGFSLPAMAAVYQGSVSFTAPTTRSDGSALPANQIQAYRVYGACTTTPAQIGTDQPGPSPLVIPSMFPADGTYQICMRAVDTGGRVSALSNVFPVTVSSVAVPGSPVLTGVTIACPGGTAPRIVTVSPLVVECPAP